MSSNGWVDSSRRCVSSSFILVPGDLEPSGERGSRVRNLSATFESSSRASIIFLSVGSIVFKGAGLGRDRGVSGPSPNGDDPRGSMDPRFDVDEDEGPGSGVLRWSSCSSSQVISSLVVRTSRCLEAPAFRPARLSTRRSKPGDESARILDERTGLDCSFRPNALSTIFGTVLFRTGFETTGDPASDSSRSIVEKMLEGGCLGL